MEIEIESSFSTKHKSVAFFFFDEYLFTARSLRADQMS